MTENKWNTGFPHNNSVFLHWIPAHTRGRERKKTPTSHSRFSRDSGGSAERCIQRFISQVRLNYFANPDGIFRVWPGVSSWVETPGRRPQWGVIGVGYSQTSFDTSGGSGLSCCCVLTSRWASPCNDSCQVALKGESGLRCPPLPEAPDRAWG